MIFCAGSGHRKTLLLISVLFFILYPTFSMGNDFEAKIINASDLVKKKKVGEALKIYNEIADGDYKKNQKARALFYKASVYDSYLDQKEMALVIYDRVIKLYPETRVIPDAVYNRAVLLYKGGKLEESIGFFSLYISKYRGTIRFQSAKRWLDKLKGEYAKKSGKIVVSQDLRVLVGLYEKVVLIDADKEIIVTDSITGKILFVGNGPFAVNLKGNSFEVNGESVKAKYIVFESQDGIVYSGEKKFRGKLSLLRNGKNINVINVIPVEEYLYGVLPKEMPSEWSKEALMAQAVASRTYALYMKAKNHENLYDLESDTNYQVYGGYLAESNRSNSAVDDTLGIVISKGGGLIPAFFHSDSGGFTEAPENVWGKKFPCLISRKDNFSLGKKAKKWQLFISYRELSSLMGFTRTGKPAIRSVKRSRSGRVKSATIISRKEKVTLSGYELRKKIGFTRLKSTLFKIFHTKKGIVFKGRGYGHGVGMSQWGAYKMAKMGYNYRDILKFYYKGADFVIISGSEFR